MSALKSVVWRSVAKGWPGSVLRFFGDYLRDREFVAGWRNPLHMDHVVTRQAGGLYFSDRDSYMAVQGGRKKLVRFSPDVFEADISFLMESLIREDDIVLDVGANIGFHTVTMAKAASRGHVYAFEPVAEMAEQNSINCALNRLDNVTIVPFALGAEAGQMEMRVATGRRELQGNSTFLAKNYFADNNPDVFEKRVIDIVKMDDAITKLGIQGHIGFIKIDTEGFDTFILEGGLETIRQHRPVMLVEAHTGRLAEVGKSWQWFLDTFPDHHCLVIHTLTRAKPYLHFEPLKACEPIMSVNLLMLPRTDIKRD